MPSSKHNGVAAWRPFDNPRLLAFHVANVNTLLRDCAAFEAAFDRPLCRGNGLKSTGKHFEFKIIYAQEPGDLVELSYGSSAVQLLVKRAPISRRLIGPLEVSDLTPGDVLRAWRRDGDGKAGLRITLGGIPELPRGAR